MYGGGPRCGGGGVGRRGFGPCCVMSFGFISPWQIISESPLRHYHSIQLTILIYLLECYTLKNQQFIN